MRIIHAHGVYLMEPDSTRTAYGVEAKRAGFRWHDFDRSHERDCRACDAHVPNRFWWTTDVRVAGKLYHQAARDPHQSPETLALLKPHAPTGLAEYGDPEPIPPARETRTDHPPPAPTRRTGKTWLERASGDDSEED